MGKERHKAVTKTARANMWVQKWACKKEKVSDLRSTQSSACTHQLLHDIVPTSNGTYRVYSLGHGDDGLGWRTVVTKRLDQELGRDPHSVHATMFAVGLDVLATIHTNTHISYEERRIGRREEKNT